MSEFQNKVALVTGAASGIGQEIAEAFGKEGASVVVADVQISEGKETVDAIKEAGGEASFIQTDVSDTDDIQTMVNHAVEMYGQLNVAVNNAGIGNQPAPITDISEEEWERVIEINQKGVWMGMKYEIPKMLASEGPSAIVNTASMSGIAASPGRTPYSASKHAIVGLTRSTALEFAEENLRVNAICPTIIDTPAVDSLSAEERESIIESVPMKRLGAPNEVADAVLWLCSEKSSFITGHALPIDGGKYNQ
jgi:NAD(P)-dependent dehydrogenase (short-subunit alcohol dehydrogenase family)